MSKVFNVAETVDARNVACPLPIIRARKAMDRVAVGDIIEVLATDKGSIADFKSFAAQTEHELIDSREEDGLYKHYLRKTRPETKEKERVFTQTISNDELLRKIEEREFIRLVDVRERGEYVEARIPGAILIPLEELADRAANLLDLNDEIAVICRSARRSDYACQILTKKGFTNVKNVVPGMIAWTGPTINDGV